MDFTFSWKKFSVTADTVLSVSKMESVSWGSWEAASSSSKSPLLLSSSWSPKLETRNPQTRKFWLLRSLLRSHNETSLVFRAIPVPESEQKMHMSNVFPFPHEVFFCLTYPQQVLQQSQVCPQDVLFFCLSFTIWLDNWKDVHMCRARNSLDFWRPLKSARLSLLEAKIELKIIWHNLTSVFQVLQYLSKIGSVELD